MDVLYFPTFEMYMTMVTLYTQHSVSDTKCGKNKQEPSSNRKCRLLLELTMTGTMDVMLISGPWVHED